jgi:hypothetical protein
MAAESTVIPVRTFPARVSSLFRAAFLAMLVMPIGCGGAPAGSNAPAAAAAAVVGLFKGDPHELTSFLGVKFGDSLVHVQFRMPNGEVKSAPYGADVYEIENYKVDSVVWERVLFEFTDRTGMQLVMARFSASSSTAVLEMLQKAIGEPTRTHQGPGTSSAELDAMWELPHGERVSFDGPNRLVAVVGPAGGPLRQDIELAQTNGLI